MKAFYQEPICKVITFDDADIISTSGIDPNPNPDPNPNHDPDLPFVEF